MKNYAGMNAAEWKEEYAAVCAEYESWKAKGLKLNMARGNPSKAQLDLSVEMQKLLTEPDDFLVDGIDTRNYGGFSGLPCAKELFAELLGCKPEQVFVGGNASLQLMYMTVSLGFTNGLLNSERPWCREDKIRWLCPAPGYDRHFRVTESLGFELITVPMTDEGPDMDVVEKMVQDPRVKGMWNVPKYSNPDGIIYSDETIRRLAALKPAAKDFVLIWDNAYCLHEFEGDFVPFDDILSLCAEAGNPDMVFEFASTSKITSAGSGIACMACSEANMKYMEKYFAVQTIGFDKINQLRHVRFLRDRAHVLELMRERAGILGPKFQLVLDILDREIAPLGIASWHRPTGGYFISLATRQGLARRTLALCKEAGVVMTDAGATYPYGIDPQNSVIRIAPSFPTLGELEDAIKIFCCSLKRAALEQRKPRDLEE